MATVSVPASQPFMRSTARATKKKAIGSSAIRLDTQRLPAGSYSCGQACIDGSHQERTGVRAVTTARTGEIHECHAPDYWSYHLSGDLSELSALKRQMRDRPIRP